MVCLCFLCVSAMVRSYGELCQARWWSTDWGGGQWAGTRKASDRLFFGWYNFTVDRSLFHMAEARYTADFAGMGGSRVELYPASAVPEELWITIQRLHYEDILAALPVAERDQAATITRWDEGVSAYSRRRARPNLQVGEDGWNDDQLLLKPLVAITRDQSNQVVGSVLTELNTSADVDHSKSYANIRANALMWGKILAPAKLPRLGGHRYGHLREAIAHP